MDFNDKSLLVVPLFRKRVLKLCVITKGTDTSPIPLPAGSEINFLTHWPRWAIDEENPPAKLCLRCVESTLCGSLCSQLWRLLKGVICNCSVIWTATTLVTSCSRTAWVISRHCRIWLVLASIRQVAYIDPALWDLLIKLTIYPCLASDEWSFWTLPG